jgi:diguanylate cyclase (GGDEF)-like protein
MEPAVLARANVRPDVDAARRDKRLRALYRRELQNNIQLSARVVAVGAVSAGGLAMLTGDAGGFVLINLPIVLAAAFLGWMVRHEGRHYVIGIGMAIGLLPALDSVAAVAMLAPSAAVAIGGVALVPLAFAVFLPLDFRPHVTWLIIVNGIYLVFTLLMIVPGGALHAADLGRPGAVVAAATLGTIVSLIANNIERRQRAVMNGQLLAVRGLYARMKEHEQDLRRQDEFLFMQQETLVVQQAELLRLNEELETIARIDALTGLGNRLRLNEDLAQLAGRIERYGGKAGLLLMDLDRFKRLNDLSGHLAGDAALRGLADVLRRTSRVGDGLYRYGGEEFLIILHDCDETVLRTAGQRYVSAIEAAGMAHPDNSPHGVVTASAGAVEFSQANCTDIDAALHDADEALYVAKSKGRNRLELASTPPQPAFTLDRERAAS